MKDGDTESTSHSEIDVDLSSTGVQYEVFLSYGGIYGNSFTKSLYTSLQCAGVRTYMDEDLLRFATPTDSTETINPDTINTALLKESSVLIPIITPGYTSNIFCQFELTKMIECQSETGGEKIIFPIFYGVAREHWEDYKFRLCSTVLLNSNSMDDKKIHLSGKGENKNYKRMRVDLAAYSKNTTESRDEMSEIFKSWMQITQFKGLELNDVTGFSNSSFWEEELVQISVENILKVLERNYVQPMKLVGIEKQIEKVKGLLQVSNGVRIIGIHGLGGLGKTTIAKVIYNEFYEQFEGHCFLEDVREISKHRDGILSLQNKLVSSIQNKKVSKLCDVNAGRNRIKDALRGRKVLIVLDDLDDGFPINMLLGNQSWFDKRSMIIITTRETKVLDVVEMAFQSEDLVRYKPDFLENHHALQLYRTFIIMSNSSMGRDSFSDKVVSVAAGLPLILVVLGLAICRGRVDPLRLEEKLKVIPHNIGLEMLRISFDVLNDNQKEIFLDIACLFNGMDKSSPCYMWDDCGFYSQPGIHALVTRSLVTIGKDNTLRMHDQLRALGRRIVYQQSSNPGKRSRLWRKEEAMNVFETHQGTKHVKALHLDFVAEDVEYHPNRLVSEDFENLRNLRFLRLGSVDLDGDFTLIFSTLKWLEWAPLGSFSPTNCHLNNLVILDLSYSQISDDWAGWSQIKSAKKLKVLNLSHCYSLTTTTHFSMLATLEQLNLSSCFGIAETDPLFGDLINLRDLDLSNCLVLRGMLDFSKFSNLDSLDLHSCTRLCSLELGGLKSLRNLNASGCRSLLSLFDLSKLKMLRKLDTSGCVNLTQIEPLEELKHLERLDMSGCISLKRLPYITKLKRLEEIKIARCEQLLEVKSFEKLESLVNLDMSWCTSVVSIPKFSEFKHLKKLRIIGMKDLEEIVGLEEAESLELLDISECKSIVKLPDMLNLKRMKKIYACQCVKLTGMIGLEELRSLEVLDISGCISIEKLPNLSNLKGLEVLKTSGCLKLSEIQGLEELKSLTLLDISGCSSLGNLPNLPSTRIEKKY